MQINSKTIEKEYWASLVPPLSPSPEDVKIFKGELLNGTTLLLGCTREIIHLSDYQMDLDPLDFVTNPLVQDWTTNTTCYTNIIGDGVLNLSKQLCDDILDMCSKNCYKFTARCFNRKMDIMRVAEHFPGVDDFIIKPNGVKTFDDYTFYTWTF